MSPIPKAGGGIWIFHRYPNSHGVCARKVPSFQNLRGFYSKCYLLGSLSKTFTPSQNNFGAPFGWGAGVDGDTYDGSFSESQLIFTSRGALQTVWATRGVRYTWCSLRSKSRGACTKNRSTKSRRIPKLNFKLQFRGQRFSALNKRASKMARIPERCAGASRSHSELEVSYPHSSPLPNRHEL